MTDAQRPKLSRSLGLDSLQETVESIERLEVRLKDLRALRDDILIDAADAGIPITRLARLANLSRERVSKIAGTRSQTYK